MSAVLKLQISFQTLFPESLVVKYSSRPDSHHLGMKTFSKSQYGKIQGVKYFHGEKIRPFVIKLLQISGCFRRKWQSPVEAEPGTEECSNIVQKLCTLAKLEEDTFQLLLLLCSGMKQLSLLIFFLSRMTQFSTLRNQFFTPKNQLQFHNLHIL